MQIAKLLFSFSDVLKATNCTFQEVNNIFCLAVGIAVYDEFFSCMCAAEFVCTLDVFARHTSSRITFLTLTIVCRSRGDVSSHQDILWVSWKPRRVVLWRFCTVLGVFVQWSRTMMDKLLRSGWYVITNGTLLFVFCSLYWMRPFLSIPLALFKTMVNARIVATPLFQMAFQFPEPFLGNLFNGADAFDSESLAVRNNYGATLRTTTLWGQVLMFICRFVVYVSWHTTIFTGSVSIQKGDVFFWMFHKLIL